VIPPSIHFAGFKQDELHEQTFRILNVSATRQRVHILRTETGSFNTVCEKKGLIAPGMYEEVTVQFVPRAYEMYVTIYDPNLFQNPETTCTSTNISFE